MPWRKKHPVLLTLIIVGILAIFYAIGSSNKPYLSATPKATDFQPVKVAETPSVIEITAVKLASDYDANEVNADSLYKGKTVEVTGTIKSIAKDITNTPYVLLGGLDSKWIDVQCMFNKPANELTALKKDTQITLVGEVSGKMMNVLVRDCLIK